MAVVVSEIYNRRGGASRDNNRTATRTWRITTDSPTTAHATIETQFVAQTGVSAGVLLPNYTDVRCQSLEYNCVSEDGLTWEATATYETDRRTSSSPLDEPLQISGDGFAITVPVYYDFVSGRAICSSANEPFQDVATTELEYSTTHFRKNVAYASFSEWIAGSYRGRLNHATIWSKAAYTIKCVQLDYSLEYDSNIGNYWNVNCGFSYNPNTWKLFILDRGFKYMDGATQKTYYDPLTHRKPSNPILLNGTGGILTPGSQEVYLDFVVNPVADFSYFTTLLGLA